MASDGRIGVAFFDISVGNPNLGRRKEFKERFVDADSVIDVINQQCASDVLSRRAWIYFVHGFILCQFDLHRVPSIFIYVKGN